MDESWDGLLSKWARIGQGLPRAKCSHIASATPGAGPIGVHSNVPFGPADPMGVLAAFDSLGSAPDRWALAAYDSDCRHPVPLGAWLHLPFQMPPHRGPVDAQLPSDPPSRPTTLMQGKNCFAECHFETFAMPHLRLRWQRSGKSLADIQLEFKNSFTHSAVKRLGDRRGGLEPASYR